MKNNDLEKLRTQDFESAGKAVLAFLHQRLGFDLWMITRTEGADWIVLQAEDHGYGVNPGSVFRWTDSFCSEMVKGNGPRIAPRSEEIPAYAAAPIGKQVPIKAYVGIPLTRSDGSLSGTLCAIHPSPQPASIVDEQALLEMLGHMLSALLQAEFKTTEATRHTEQLKVESLTDAMTTLYNRRGWDQLILAEEARCRRFGHPAAVLMIDLDGLKAINDSQGHAAGDALIVRTGDVLKKVVRSVDIAARLGGDEFGIISTECNRAEGEVLLRRVREALAEADIQASVGFALRKPDRGLDVAWKEADQLMYAEKRGS